MSWLQRPVLRKKHIYLLHLFVVSTVFHLIVVMGCLAMFKTSHMHTMVVHIGALSEAPIVFMPTQKIVKDQTVTKKIVEAPKPKTIESKKSPVRSSSLDKTVKEKAKPKQQTTVQQNQTKQVKQPTASKTEVVRVGREELAEVALQRHVMEQLKKVWHPPAGVADDVSCTVYFFVNAEGKAIEVKVKESSDSTLYDIAVRGAVLRAQFPVQARKKEFTIAFKP